jgi:hypothetical protein
MDVNSELRELKVERDEFLENLPDDVFENAWQKTEIYDLIRILGLAARYPYLSDVIRKSVRRIDIYEDIFTRTLKLIEEYPDLPNTIKLSNRSDISIKKSDKKLSYLITNSEDDFPFLKEINLISFTFNRMIDIQALLEVTKIVHNLTDISIDDNNESIGFTILGLIWKRPNFITDIRNNNPKSEVKRVSYANSLLLLDISPDASLDEYKSDIILIAPKTIAAYGDCDTSDICESNSIERIHIIGRTISKNGQRFDILHALFVNDFQYAMNNDSDLVPDDNNDQIRTNIHVSIREITFEEKETYTKRGMVIRRYNDTRFVDDEWMDIYPTIVKFQVPIFIDQLEYYIPRFPNVKRYNIIVGPDDRELYNHYYEAYPNIYFNIYYKRLNSIPEMILTQEYEERGINYQEDNESESNIEAGSEPEEQELEYGSGQEDEVEREFRRLKLNIDEYGSGSEYSDSELGYDDDLNDRGQEFEERTEFEKENSESEFEDWGKWDPNI